jgi:hypothetical protein
MESPYYIEKLINDALKKMKAEFDGSESEFEKTAKSKIDEFLNCVLEPLFKTTYEYCTSNKSGLKRRERKIKKSIKNKFEKGIVLFEGFIELNTQISSLVYKKFHGLFTEIEDQFKLDILIATHVRACQVANEIKILVENGFADGALARWRTLHEICVIFLFLYDADHVTVKMYSDYEAIESWRKAKDYQECCEKLGWEKLDDEELENLENERKIVIDAYGKEFSESYGWTLNHLPKGRRNFKELEKLVDIDHLRHVYAWSSENVHAGVSGIRTRLGLRNDEQQHFLTGPNDFGFTDPVQFASYSLAEVSSVLIGMEDSILHSIYEELLYFFQNELVREFSNTDI